MWDSTAAYHIWPWPLKFAVILNLPAVLVGGFVSYPLSNAMTKNSEWLVMLAWALFTALLWYFIGKKADMQIASLRRTRTAILANLFFFTALSLTGALVMPGYVGYFWYGGFLWIVFVIWFARRKRRESKEMLG